jgi:hypothetical protein
MPRHSKPAITHGFLLTEAQQLYGKAPPWHAHAIGHHLTSSHDCILTTRNDVTQHGAVENLGGVFDVSGEGVWWRQTVSDWHHLKAVALGN